MATLHCTTTAQPLSLHRTNTTLTGELGYEHEYVQRTDKKDGVILAWRPSVFERVDGMAYLPFMTLAITPLMYNTIVTYHDIIAVTYNFANTRPWLRGGHG
jgi:hypothetical protein